MMDKLSEAEKELLAFVRGHQGVCFCLVIQSDISEWRVTLESREPDPVFVQAGEGRSFAEAWQVLKPAQRIREFPKPHLKPQGF